MIAHDNKVWYVKKCVDEIVLLFAFFKALCVVAAVEVNRVETEQLQ